MRRRDLILALPVIAFASPALASGGGAEKAEGQFVDLSPVALPIVVGGRLINYVFVQVRVNLTPRADPLKLREKEPYFRDALVRAAHRTPFTRNDDYTRLDEQRLIGSLRAAVTALAGAGMVSSISIVTQTPKKRTGLPRPTVAARH